MNISLRYKKNEDDAAFLVNEAFLKILSGIDKIDVNKSLLPWMKRIMVNTAIDDFRKNKKHAQTFAHTSEEFEEIGTTAVEEHLEFESAEFFQSLLNQLPNATNHVFNLFAIDGYTHKEVADMLSISIETSKWHVKQARKRLKELYLKTENKQVG